MAAAICLVVVNAFTYMQVMESSGNAKEGTFSSAIHPTVHKLNTKLTILCTVYLLYPIATVSFPVPWGRIAGKEWGDPNGKHVLAVHGKL